MKKIKIGNDIRVRASLNQLGVFDMNNIKQLRCYFVRQDDEDDAEKWSKRERMYYDPTEYTIGMCGLPGYNALPYNQYCYTCGMFGSFTDPHWFPTYNGFGVNSLPFVHIPHEFLAPSKVLSEKNRIEAYFPADCQRMLGEYKFIAVVQLYQVGWGTNNIRTYTIDYGTVFALVAGSDGSTGDTVIDLDVKVPSGFKTVPSSLTLRSTNYSSSGSYAVINFGETDTNGQTYNIVLSTDSGEEIPLTYDNASTYVTFTKGATSHCGANENGTIWFRDHGHSQTESVSVILKEDPTVQAEISIEGISACVKVDGNLYEVGHVNVTDNLDDNGNLLYGQNLDITITPDTGYYLSNFNITVGGIRQIDVESVANRTGHIYITNVTETVNITYSCTTNNPNKCYITLDPNSVGYVVNSDIPASVDKGTEGTGGTVSFYGYATKTDIYVYGVSGTESEVLLEEGNQYTIGSKVQDGHILTFDFALDDTSTYDKIIVRFKNAVDIVSHTAELKWDGDDLEIVSNTIDGTIYDQESIVANATINSKSKNITVSGTMGGKTLSPIQMWYKTTWSVGSAYTTEIHVDVTSVTDDIVITVIES